MSIKTEITLDVSQYISPLQSVVKATADATSFIIKQFNDVKKSMDLKTPQVDISQVTQSANKIVETLDKAGKDAAKSFEKAGYNAGENFKDGVEQAVPKTKSVFSDMFSSVTSLAAGFGLAQIGSKVFDGVLNAGKAAVTEYIALDKQVKNIGTLGTQNFEEFADLATKLSKTVPESASNIAGAVYQAISAGLQGSNAEIIAFTEQAAKVAVAGGSTTEAAVNGLTSVLNSYKLGVGDTAKVSDTFFAAIKLGKTTFDEMNGAISQVVPTASAAGIGFDEVAAAIAQMTALGVPTAQASTQLRAAMLELQKPTGELEKLMNGLGLTTEDIQKKLAGQGLIATLGELEQEAAKNGKSFNLLFGSAEAGSAAALLTGENFERASKTLEQTRKEIEDGVSTKAYETAAQSIENRLGILSNNIQAVFTNIFTVLQPIIDTALGLLISSFEGIDYLLTPVIDTIVNIFSSIANSPFAKLIVAIVKDIETAFKSLIPTTEQIEEGFKKFTQTIIDLSPYILGIAAAMGAYQIATNLVLIKTTALSIVTKAAAAAQLAYNTVVGLGSTIMTAARIAMTALSNGSVFAAAKLAIVTAAQWLLNAALTANPIGLVVVAIGALVAGLAYAYKESEGFRNVLNKLYEYTLKPIVDALMAAAKWVGEFFGIVDTDEEKLAKERAKRIKEQEIKQKETIKKQAEIDKKAAEEREKLKAEADKKADEQQKERAEKNRQNAVEARQKLLALEKDINNTINSINNSNAKIQFDIEIGEIEDNIRQLNSQLNKIQNDDTISKNKKIELSFVLGKDIAIQEATKKLDILNANTKKQLDEIDANFQKSSQSILDNDKYAKSDEGKKKLLDLETAYKNNVILINQQESNEAIRIIEDRENKIIDLMSGSTKKKLDLTKSESAKIQELQLELISDEKEKSYQKELLALQSKFDTEYDLYKDNYEIQDLLTTKFVGDYQALNQKFKTEFMSTEQMIRESLDKLNQISGFDGNLFKDAENTDELKANLKTASNALQDDLRNRRISYENYIAEMEKLQEQETEIAERENNKRLDFIVNYTVGLANALAAANEIYIENGKKKIENDAKIQKQEEILKEGSLASDAEKTAAEAELTKLRQEQKYGDLESLQEVTAVAKNLFKENTIAYKAMAIAEAGIATWLGATKAAARAELFPFNFVLAGLITAAGLANIAKIAGIGFEKGGYTGDVGTSDVAGVVHGKEYVIPAKQTNKHFELLEMIHNNKLSDVYIDKNGKLSKGANLSNKFVNESGNIVNFINPTMSNGNIGNGSTKDITKLSKEISVLNRNVAKLEKQSYLKMDFDFSNKTKISGSDIDIVTTNFKRKKLSRF